MKSVKCSECGFVGWAEAERCKKCGVLRMPNPVGDSDQTVYPYRVSQTGYRSNSGQNLKQGLAVASLVIGILGLFTFGILGIGTITGITLSIVALSKAKRNPYVYGGKGLATAGLVTNVLSVAMIVPIGIVAAIAIPNLLASARAANEGSSISTLRKIHAAETTYQATEGNGAFGTLDQLSAAGLVDPTIASGRRFGYRFEVHLTATGYDEAPGFQVVGVPFTYGKSGIRSFFIDETGVIRAEDNHGAEATDLSPPLDSDRDSSDSPPRRAYVD